MRSDYLTDSIRQRCAETVSKNKRWVRTSSEWAATQLRVTYQEGLAIFRPLLRRIARTDRLEGQD